MSDHTPSSIKHLSLRGRVIAWLLSIANTKPPIIDRPDFYDLKQRICERYGRFVGHDLQEIVKECWGPWEADQFGERSPIGCRGTACRVCGGTGAFDVRWVSLESWAIGRRIFHRPSGDTRIRPDPSSVTIHGLVKHRDYGRGADEARLWLYLLCGEWELLWRQMTIVHCCGWYWWPLLNVQRIASNIALRFHIERCVQCKMRFISGRARRCYCRECRSQAQSSSEIPF
jgi:hypothetical protein